MKSKFNISIIGTGNVASYLSTTFEKSGHTICEVAGRNFTKAKSICGKLYTAEPIAGFDLSSSRAEIFILAVSDDALPIVAQELVVPFEKAIVAHTSGSQPISILEYIPSSTGVFYPLQSFTTGQFPEASKIPFCIEGSDDISLSKLQSLAESISEAVYEVNSEERKLLHLSAVFASNFTNYMIHCAEILLDQADINYKILEPLVQETVRKAFALGTEKAQTGPAVRKDLGILEKHKNALSSNPRFSKIYELVSNEIIETIATKRNVQGN